MKLKNFKNGFTLVELLVVVVIIGILTSLAMVALGSIRTKSRDAKRITDIKQMQAALELYFADENNYPTVWNASQPLVGTNSSKTYMTKMPSDPMPTEASNYSYAYTSNTYVINYTLASAIGGITAGSFAATPSGINNPPCTDVATECSSAVCGCGAPLVCGSTDFASNGSLTLNSTNASGYETATTYSAVKIGNQCWLDKNINIGAVIDPAGVGAMTSVNATTSIKRYCYQGDDVSSGINLSSCNVYNASNGGGLYTWAMAMYLPYSYNTTQFPSANYSGSGLAAKRQGICPVGWHIPSDYEFEILENYLDSANVGLPYTPNLCNNSAHGFYADNICSNQVADFNWRGSVVGTKLQYSGSSNLNFPISGYWNDNPIYLFKYRSSNVSLIASTQRSASDNWIRGLQISIGLTSRTTEPKVVGASLRCLKD